MTSRSVAIALAAGLMLLLWLFIGVEKIGREHGETDFELFAKQWLSFRIVFENTAQCGECDLRPWELMSQDARSSFAEYCYARFGLAEVRPCYAIFAEGQRMANEPLAQPARAP